MWQRVQRKIQVDGASGKEIFKEFDQIFMEFQKTLEKKKFNLKFLKFNFFSNFQSYLQILIEI